MMVKKIRENEWGLKPYRILLPLSAELESSSVTQTSRTQNCLECLLYETQHLKNVDSLFFTKDKIQVQLASHTCKITQLPTQF